MLPDTTARALKNAVEATPRLRHRRARDPRHRLRRPPGGHRRVPRAALRAGRGRRTLAELADTLTTDDIARHLYTAGQPDPDLVIRTSGEQRLSNFLLWQSAYSELYFCDAYWPAFREIDFLRALRSYAARQRRYGR